jgi:hypothetical protein
MDEWEWAGVSKTTHDRATGTGTGRRGAKEQVSKFQGFRGFKAEEQAKAKQGQNRHEAKAMAGAGVLRPV